MIEYVATSTIGERIRRQGSAERLAADPLIWASADAIRAIPADSFRSFAGPYGRNWRIEHVR